MSASIVVDRNGEFTNFGFYVIAKAKKSVVFLLG
jgi:hypothetical protein